jgi:hypothetical protein
VPQSPTLSLTGDYDADGEWGAATQAKICCLEYGAPYLNLGFSLASRIQLSSPNVMDALISAEVCNIATVALVMMFIAGFVRFPPRFVPIILCPSSRDALFPRKCVQMRGADARIFCSLSLSFSL